MKIKACVTKAIEMEMEVDDKFAELFEKEDNELKDELFLTIYMTEGVINVSSVSSEEDGKKCIIEF